MKGMDDLAPLPDGVANWPSDEGYSARPSCYYRAIEIDDPNGKRIALVEVDAHGSRRIISEWSCKWTACEETSHMVSHYQEEWERKSRAEARKLSIRLNVEAGIAARKIAAEKRGE